MSQRISAAARRFADTDETPWQKRALLEEDRAVVVTARCGGLQTGDQVAAAQDRSTVAGRGRGPKMRELRRWAAQKVRSKPSSVVTVYVMAMLPRTSDVLVAQ